MQLERLSACRIPKGSRVILRPDLDLTAPRRAIEGDFRLQESLPAMKFILHSGGRLRIFAHWGRPGGKPVASLSLRPVALVLEKMLGGRIIFLQDPCSEKLFYRYDQSADIIFFENLRFSQGEEKNDRMFAKRLSRWGDMYVNEAFANSHREHASITGIPRFLPSFAGIRFAKEVTALQRVLEHPGRPFVTIFGGAKLETKLPLVEKFLRRGARVIVGGVLANDFFMAKGLGVGKSHVDTALVGSVSHLVGNKNLYLPSDVRVGKNWKDRPMIVDVAAVCSNDIIFDIGPGTLSHIREILRGAKTVVWNGPMGVAEEPKFSKGTVGVARLVAGSDSFSVVGGGDTVSLLSKYNVLRGFDHVSTGGGAMLEFLAKGDLPGIKAISGNTSK